MFKNRIGGFKRAAALVMSLLMLAAQFALPVCALAQDVSMLPEVALYYAAGEEQMSVYVSYEMYGEQPVYWAVLPEDAMGADVTLEIAASGDERLTFTSTHGYQFTASSADAVDSSFVTNIEVYYDGDFMGACPLYLSTTSLPEYEEEEEEDEPVYYDPKPVTATYYDQDGSYVSDFTEYVGMEGFTFDPYSHLPEGYTLITTDSVFVSMDEDGELSQTAVEFRVEKEQVYYDPQPVTATYYDENGDYVFDFTEYVGMEGFTFDPWSHLPEGYTLITTDSVFVSMDEDGELSQTAVEFRVEKEQVYYDPQPVTATYYDENGDYVFDFTEYVGMEGFTFDPWSRLPEGYTLITTDSVFVSMDENGNLSQTAVDFRVEKEQVYYDPQPVTIVYFDQDDNEVFVYTEDVGMEGFTIDPFSHLPEGYTLLSTDSVFVRINEYGQLTQSMVAFTVEKIAEPEEPDEPEQPEEPDEPVIPDEPEEPVWVDADVRVQYVDDVVIYEEIYTLPKGNHAIAPNETLVKSLGYELVSEGDAFVESFGDGTAAPEPVQFFVRLIEQPALPEMPDEPELPEEPVEPEMPEEPEQPEQEDELPEGATVLEELDCEGQTTGKGLNVRSGPGKKYDSLFKLSKTGTVVNVHRLVQNESGEKWYAISCEGREGYVSAEFLKLIEKKAVEAEVVFWYVDDEGASLYDPQKATLGEGTYDTAAFAVTEPEGYLYSHASADTIVVDENGADPDEVTFVYRKVQPVEADVTFYYVDELGQTLMHENTRTLAAGSHDVMTYWYEAPQGYTYSHASADAVVVDENGASPNAVTFHYVKDQPVEIRADVTFRYVDENGEAIPGYAAHTETFGEGTHDVSAYRMDVSGYDFISASHQQVTVSADGADAAEVLFTYRKKPVQAQVTFHYRDENGNPLLDSASEMLGAAVYEARSFAAEIPGYSFVDVSAQQITVNENGADPAEVVFTYQRIPAQAAVTFLFVDQNGENVAGLNGYEQTLTEGAYDTVNFALAAPDGYIYSHPSAAQIIIDENGADPAAVTFIYTKLPNQVVLPVRYLDADRNPLLPETAITFDADDFGSSFDSSVYRPGEINGYAYASVNSDTIAIDAMGNVTPQALEFTYVVRPKAEASVTFEYICDNRAVASPLTVKLPEGENDVMEYAAYPDGYNFVSVSSETVVVSADGKASPSVVTFTYEKKSTTAELKVHYRTSIGTELPGSPEIRKLEAGEHTILPDAEYVPEGYNLSGSTKSYQVTVGSDLVAYPNSVTFTCYDASIKGKVTVNYYDSETSKLIVTETRELSPGYYELEPDEALVATKGKYVRSDVLTDTRVDVKENGQTTPSSVSFYFKPENIDVYQGYLLVTRQTPMRNQPNETSNAVMVLPVDTVLWTAGQYQSGSINWNSAQTVVGTDASGFVNDADVRRISSAEAQARIEEYNEQHSRPEQREGYYITIMDSVPLRRYMDTAAQAKYLKKNTVVYVSAQEYDDNGYLWHETTYDNVTGYVRDGQLRRLTDDEVDEYLSAGNPINPGSGSGTQYDPNGESSYGYVTKDSVNFRSSPNGTRLKMLNKYGMALILGTKEVNGVEWYNVNYSGQTGWIHGDYFHQMTLSEFTSFMGSKEYYQGITNNTNVSSGTPATTPPSSGSTGSATQGGNVSSVEDWNVGIWQNPGAAQTTYQPFNPYATPVATLSPKGQYQTETAGVKLYAMANTAANATTLPKDAQVEVTGTVTMNGKTWYSVIYNGQTGYLETGVTLKQATATATPEPTSTFVIGTMIPINYEDESKETQTGTVPWGLIGGAIVLVGGAGGVYAYALNQNKRRKAAAARAAASRRAKAAAGTAAAGAASPYARRAVAAPPAGAQQRPEQANPYGRPYGGAQNPYGSVQNAQPYTSAQPTYQQPADSYRSYAQPQESVNNPYVRPQQSKPYTAPVPPMSAGTEESRPVSTNPYARPIGSVPGYTQGSQTESPSAAPRRRATRMQRYHAAEDGENNE